MEEEKQRTIKAKKIRRLKLMTLIHQKENERN